MNVNELLTDLSACQQALQDRTEDLDFEYGRAQAAEAKVAALQEENCRLKEALEQYANRENWSEWNSAVDFAPNNWEPWQIAQEVLKALQDDLTESETPAAEDM